MTQRKYALKLLHTIGILDEKPSTIPIDPNIKLTPIEGDLLPYATLYKRLVGKLLYLTIRRSDLSFLTIFILKPLVIVTGQTASSLDAQSLVTASFSDHA